MQKENFEVIFKPINENVREYTAYLLQTEFTKFYSFILRSVEMTEKFKDIDGDYFIMNNKAITSNYVIYIIHHPNFKQ